MSSRKHTPRTGDIYLSHNEYGDTYIILRGEKPLHGWDWIYLFMEGEEGGDYLKPAAGYYCVNEDMSDPEDESHDYIFVCNQDDVTTSPYLSCGACEFCGCHVSHHEACPQYEKPYEGLLFDSFAEEKCVYSEAGDWCETHNCISNMCGSR
jgi:hypothetical protein